MLGGLKLILFVNFVWWINEFVFFILFLIKEGVLKIILLWEYVWFLSWCLDCVIVFFNDKFCFNLFLIKKKVVLVLYLFSSGNICFILLVGLLLKVKVIIFLFVFMCCVKFLNNWKFFVFINLYVLNNVVIIKNSVMIVMIIFFFIM